MARLHAVPRLHDTTEVCTYYYAHQRRYLRNSVPGSRRASTSRKGSRPRLRRSGRPAPPPVRSEPALRCRHEDTCLNLASMTNGAGLVRRSGTSASLTIPIGVSFRCTATSCSVSNPNRQGGRPVRRTHRGEERTHGSKTMSIFPRKTCVNSSPSSKPSSRAPWSRVPEDPERQLWGSIGAVFGSWNNERAITYRTLERRTGHCRQRAGDGFGISARLLHGVAFTASRHGEKTLYGEFLSTRRRNVVAGYVRRSKSARGIPSWPRTRVDEEERDTLPSSRSNACGVQAARGPSAAPSNDTTRTCRMSSSRSRGPLFMLQCRGGKRTGSGDRIAVDMVRTADQGKRGAQPVERSSSTAPAPIFEPAAKQAPS